MKEITLDPAEVRELLELINKYNKRSWISDIYVAEKIISRCWKYAAHTTDSAFANSRIAYGAFFRICFILGQRAERAKRAAK